MTDVDNAEDLVSLRGTEIVLFRRAPRDRWRVDRDVLYRVIEWLETLGYAIGKRWQLDTRLNSYLLDLEYFHPGAIPSAWYALVEGLYDEQPRLVGETLEALGVPSYERREYADERSGSVLRAERISRREIEILIRDDLRVNPDEIGLRPLVGTTENAARAQWHYGMWGIYKRIERVPIALMFIYGHIKGGLGGETWISASVEDSDRWWAPSLRDFARIGCAVSGRTLFEWGRRVDSQDPLTAELFEVDRPAMRLAGEMDTVSLAADPTGRPTLEVV